MSSPGSQYRRRGCQGRAKKVKVVDMVTMDAVMWFCVIWSVYMYMIDIYVNTAPCLKT